VRSFWFCNIGPTINKCLFLCSEIDKVASRHILFILMHDIHFRKFTGRRREEGEASKAEISSRASNTLAPVMVVSQSQLSPGNRKLKHIIQNPLLLRNPKFECCHLNFQYNMTVSAPISSVVHVINIYVSNDTQQYFPHDCSLFQIKCPALS
jgi:hypothetical protein